MKSHIKRYLYTIYYIGFVTIKEYIKIDSAKPLYLIFIYLNGYFEEINGNKYLTLAPTNESKEKIKKYEGLWIKIRDFIRSIIKNLDDYDEKYIKIKFNSDDELSLNKTINIPTITIVVRAIFSWKWEISKSFLRWMLVWIVKMEDKNELKEIDI